MSNSIADEIFDTFLIVSGMHLLSLEDKTFCISVLLGVHADEGSCFSDLTKLFPCLIFLLQQVWCSSLNM